MTDYTKGDWKAYKTDFKPDRWTICAGKDGEWGIAKTVQDGKIPPSAKEANAHLIAAAPDMYKALRKLVDNGIVYEGGAYDEVFTALAKAKGLIYPPFPTP